jgi:hypothetical protein
MMTLDDMASPSGSVIGRCRLLHLCFRVQFSGAQRAIRAALGYEVQRWSSPIDSNWLVRV